jgi:hypothetical protein
MYISLKRKLDFSSERRGIFSLNFVFSRQRRLRFQLLFMLKDKHKGVSAGTMHQKIVKSAEKVLRC